MLDRVSHLDVGIEILAVIFVILVLHHPTLLLLMGARIIVAVCMPIRATVGGMGMGVSIVFIV